MVRWLSILLVIPLVVLMISDIRSRTVSSWWLLTFGILNAVFLVLLDGWRCVILRIAVNLLLLLLVGFSLWGYSKIRHKRLPELLGMGDVIFLYELSPVFGWSYYMKFIVVSSLAGILIWPLFRKYQALKTGVPMVSVMAFVYLVSIGCKLFMV